MKSKLAIWSFVLSVLALLPLLGIDYPGFSALRLSFLRFLTLGFYIAPFLWLAGLITSIISLRIIKKDNLEGTGFAIASIVISLAYLIFMILSIKPIYNVLPFI